MLNGFPTKPRATVDHVMARSFTLIALAIAAAGFPPAPALAQAPSPLAGVWSLNRSLSEFPTDIGFNPAWMTAATTDGRGGGGGGSTGGGGGRRGSGGGSRTSGGAAAPFAARPENYEDSRRVQLLTGEARNPASRLMIVDTMSAVTITNE